MDRANLLPRPVVNLVDDSLLADVRAAGCLTPSVTRRMIGYSVLAQSTGAGAILNWCSSVGEAADLLMRAVKIGARMAENAGVAARAVGVVAMLRTTLDPTCGSYKRRPSGLARSWFVRRYLVEGAFDVLISGDDEGHDRMVTGEILRASAENDVVGLAQGSMARLTGALEGEVAVPLLSSPRLGVEELKEVRGES